MAQQHRQATANKHVAGQWAQQQKTWAEKDRNKSMHAAQHQQAADGPGATDDEPTNGEWAQKRRDKMQHQDKAEGEPRE